NGAVLASSGAPTSEAAVVWRTPAFRLALAAFPLWCTVSVLIFPAPWLLRVLVAGLFGLTVVLPHAGLLTLAAIVPLSHVTHGLSLQPFRVAEAAVLAFFAGWLVRMRSDRRGPRVPGTVAWVLAAVVGAGNVSAMWNAGAIPGEASNTALEGLGLMAATVTLFRARPRLAHDVPVAMVSSAVAGAAAGVFLTGGVSASYLAAMLCVAAGMAASTTRRAGGEWLMWCAAACALIIGLYLASSSNGGLVWVRGGLASAWTDHCAGPAGALYALASLTMSGLIWLRAGRALARRPRDLRVLGCAGGMTVVMATWLAGPCRATSDSAFSMWILVGLVAGLSGSVLIATSALTSKPAQPGADALRA
ncbi:MAG TPA: hypothetical protein VF219_05730, partial [Vicinamibacterales bacterium]